MLSHLDVDNDIDNYINRSRQNSDDIGKERRGETTSNTISHFRKDHTPTGTLRRRPRRAWAKPAGKTNQDQGATLQDLSTANPDQRQIHQPGVREAELPSSHPGRSPPPGPTKQTGIGRRPPTPNPGSANVSPGDREGDPTSQGQMETRWKIRRNLARNPRRLRSSPPWRHTGRSNHHSRHHGLPHPRVAPKTRNRSPGQTTHLSSHEMVHRPGLSRRQPSRRTHHRCAGFQHPTTPAHEGPTPQPSRGCPQDRRSYRCPLGDHRRL